MRSSGVGRLAGYSLLMLLGCTSMSDVPIDDRKPVMFNSRYDTQWAQAKYMRKNPGVNLPEWVFTLKDYGPISEDFPSADLNGNSIPCGTKAVAYVLRSYGEKVDNKMLTKINQMRQGGFSRNFLSVLDQSTKGIVIEEDFLNQVGNICELIFDLPLPRSLTDLLVGINNSRGKEGEITWPSEIVDIGNSFGYNVKTHLGGEDALKRIIDSYSKEDRIIVRVTMDGPMDQHYGFFNPRTIKKEKRLVLQGKGSLKNSILEFYSFSKRVNSKK